MNEKRLGNLYGATGGNYAGWVYDKDGIAATINTCGGGGREPMTVDIVAMRGRDKTNPNHRGKANENYEQRLEPNAEGICNALTTVQKDNMVLIKQATKNGYTDCKIGGGGKLKLPNKQNEERQSDRRRNDLPNADNGEYP